MKAWCPSCGVDFEHTDDRYLPGYCPECHEKLGRKLAEQLKDAVPLFRAIEKRVQQILHR